MTMAIDTQTRVQIYLADQRNCSQTDHHCSYESVCNEEAATEKRNPFGTLYRLSDDALLAGASLTHQVMQPTDVLLIPVAGGLEFTDNGTTDFVEPGQVQHLTLSAGMTYSVTNPYETETIQFLQGWLTSSSPQARPDSARTHFDLSQKNRLLPLMEPAGPEPGKPGGCRLFIGQYTGRYEGLYTVANRHRGVYVFVLNGVFEVQNRLLHEKDGLSLLHIQGETIAFEALSNQAILLLFGLPTNG